MRSLFLVCAAGLLAGQTDLRFEVASVKRTDPKTGCCGRRFSCDSKHCSAEGIPLQGLAFDAYGLKEGYQMEADPSKLPSDRYDVEATLPDGATIEQARVMLRGLLAERLGLVVHRETRQLPEFRLVVAKGGPKLKKSVAAPDPSGPSIVTKNGIAQFADNARSGLRLTIEEEQLHGRQETMGGLAHWLVLALHGPVIDATGIEGEYDYDLSFEPIAATPTKGTVYVGLAPPPAGALVPRDPPAGENPTIFTVIKQQLGLQLDAVKSVPVEVIVLDKANREPTAN